MNDDLVIMLTEDQENIISELFSVAWKHGMADSFDFWNCDTVEVNIKNGDPVLKMKNIGSVPGIEKFLFCVSVESIRLLLALIDCFTDELEPDYYFDQEECIVRDSSCNRSDRSIQKHLNEFLCKEKLSELKEKHEIFDQYHNEAKMVKIRFEIGEESCSPPTKPWNGLTEEEFERREREIADERMSRDNPEGPTFFY